MELNSASRIPTEGGNTFSGGVQLPFQEQEESWEPIRGMGVLCVKVVVQIARPVLVRCACA